VDEQFFSDDLGAQRVLCGNNRVVVVALFNSVIDLMIYLMLQKIP
jgi:hypothetical protein